VGEIVPNETCDIVAVKLIILDRHHLLIQELGHTSTHTLADISDDGLVSRLQGEEDVDDTVKLFDQINLLFLVSVALEVPATLSEVSVERVELADLVGNGRLHIVLYENTK
jgi:hypothetical protein